MAIDIKKIFPSTEEYGEAAFFVSGDKIVEVCKKLRDEHAFNCLSCLTGTDRADHFEIVYHLFSYEQRETVIIKVKLEKTGVASLASVSRIWPSADWMERETYDLLGVEFIGHPNLKRILLPEDWHGHPLRKDYSEGEEYHGMTTTREFPCG